MHYPGAGDEVLLLHVIPFNVGEQIGGIYDADLAAPVFAKPDPKVDEKRVKPSQNLTFICLLALQGML